MFCNIYILHLADAFIQSDLHCIQVTVSTFYQLLLSLGIEPMILALLAPCSTRWATGKLDRPGAYVRILFVDSSSAFNAFHPHLHLWVDQQLPDRQAADSEAGEIHIQHPYDQHWSSSELSLYMNDCTSTDPSVKLLKFADDTTLIGLVQDSDESVYRQEVKELLSCAVLTTWSLTRSKQWRWSWTSGETPCSPPTHHHEQHCICSGVIQVPEKPTALRTWSGTLT